MRLAGNSLHVTRKVTRVSATVASVLTFKTGDEPAIAAEFGRLCTFRSDQTIGVPPRWQNISQLVTKSRFPSPWRTQARQRSSSLTRPVFHAAIGYLTQPKTRQKKHSSLAMRPTSSPSLRLAVSQSAISEISSASAVRSTSCFRLPSAAIRRSQAVASQIAISGIKLACVLLPTTQSSRRAGRSSFGDSDFQHSPELSVKV